MSSPGKPSGNWGWHLAPGAFTPALERRLLEVTRICGRDPAAPQQKSR